MAKKGNIIISLEKGNVGVYSGGEGWRLYIRKKDDLDKKFIAMFWTRTDGSDSWKKPGASVDGKLWEDKYGWEFYKIKRRAQDILNKEGYLKDGGEIYSNGGSTGNPIGHLEERIQDAFKQPNKWHFINETIDGHTIQMKFFIGAKEVDTQIFKIDGIDMTGKVPGYGKKRETYKAIMGVLDKYFSEAPEKIMLEVDGYKTSLDDFIKENTAPDVNPLSEEAMNAIKNLRVGESYNTGGAGDVEIKRIMEDGGKTDISEGFKELSKINSWFTDNSHPRQVVLDLINSFTDQQKRDLIINVHKTNPAYGDPLYDITIRNPHNNSSIKVGDVYEPDSNSYGAYVIKNGVKEKIFLPSAKFDELKKFVIEQKKYKDGGKTPEIKGLGKFIPIAKIKEITKYYDSHKKPLPGEDPEESEAYAWIGAMEKYSILGDSTIVETILAEHSFGKSLMDIHKEIKKMESGGALKHATPELLNAGIEIVGENPELIALKNGGKSSMQELFDQSSAILENRFLQGRIDKEEYEKRSKELKEYAKKHNVEFKDGGKPEAKKEEKPAVEAKPVNTDAIKQLIELGFINDDYVLTNKGRRIADLHKFCFPIGAHPFSYVKYEVEDLYSKPQYVLVNDTIYYTDGFLVYELGGHLPESLRDSAIQNHTLGNSLAKTISKNLVEYVPYAYCSGISIDEKVNANEGFIVFSSLVNSNNIYVNSFVYNYVIRNYNITGWMADPNGGSLIHAMHNGVTQAIIMINANAIGVNPAFAIFDRDKLMGDLRNKHTQLFIKGESYKEFISGWKSETPSGSGKLVDVENKIKGLEILVELSDDENEIKELNAEIYKLKNSLK